MGQRRGGFYKAAYFEAITKKKSFRRNFSSLFHLLGEKLQDCFTMSIIFTLLKVKAIKIFEEKEASRIARGKKPNEMNSSSTFHTSLNKSSACFF